MKVDFSEVKAGDSVYTEDRNDNITVLCVERVTATQFTTNGGHRFRREDGFLIGSNALGGWNRTYAKPLAPEVKQRLHRQNWRRRLRGELTRADRHLDRFTTEELVKYGDELKRINDRIDHDKQLEANRV